MTTPYRQHQEIQRHELRWYQFLLRWRAWRAARAVAREAREEARRDSTRSVVIVDELGSIRIELHGEDVPWSGGAYLSKKHAAKFLENLRSGDLEVCFRCSIYGAVVFVPRPWRERIAAKLEAVSKAGI